MKIEIDQSGKIEDTSKHTFLAFSNSEHFVLKISGTEKRKLQAPQEKREFAVSHEKF